ncbi:hypothetical protein TcBrA4_0123840 [Trypanosoma cruzi]|nr:hypothetical protein TcBrA4_0123840 [Trypanosoma cruzi]
MRSCSRNCVRRVVDSEKLDAMQRHNEELQSQLREARRGQEKLDALQRHNEELQSQLREACRGQEKAGDCGGGGIRSPDGGVG